MFTPRDYELDCEYRQRQMTAANQRRLIGRIQQDSTTLVIPMHTALHLCREIRHRRMRWWITPGAMRCRGCLLRAEKGIPARLTAQPDCTGCAAVRALYRQRFA